MSRANEPRLPGFVRQLLHLWFYLSRGLTLGVRGAVLDGEGRVLLVRHTYLSGWHLPGGGVERGETAEAALARELEEEAGVTLTGAPELRGVLFNTHVTRRDHVLLYAVRDFRAAPKAPDREIAEARFFPLHALPDGATDGTRARLAELAAGRSPPAQW